MWSIFLYCEQWKFIFFIQNYMVAYVWLPCKSPTQRGISDCDYIQDILFSSVMCLWRSTLNPKFSLKVWSLPYLSACNTHPNFKRDVSEKKLSTAPMHITQTPAQYTAPFHYKAPLHSQETPSLLGQHCQHTLGLGGRRCQPLLIHRSSCVTVIVNQSF